MRRRRNVSYVGGETGEVVHGPGADEVPGVLEHRRKGFVPLQDLPMTWAPLWDVWPAEHRAAVPETREGWWAPTAARDGSGPEVRLVRSPWPTATVDDVVAAGYGLLQARHPAHEHERDPAPVAAAVRELLTWDEPRLLAARPAADGQAQG